MTLTTTRHHQKPYVADAARRLIVPRLNAAPLAGEIDYDDLEIVREWREYDVASTGDVRYFMYELIHRDVGQVRPVRYYKAVRLLRVTRVPRYLRQTGKDPDAIFDQQRDVLAALRQEDVLFVNLIAKAPNLPLIFAYGVQAIGSTEEEARALADRSYAVLAGQLDGTYQQLEYQPLRKDEAEALVRYRAEWNHLAVARGRPKPTGGSMSMGGLLDGNRTDVESAANQLESFLRGMGDQSFLLTLISVPVAPLEITRAWRNLANKLSDIRSDTDGVRSVNAGIGIPLGLGHGLGESVSQSHSAGESAGEGFTVGESVSHTDGVNYSESISQTEGVSVGQSQAESFGVTDTFAISHGVTEGASQGLSASESLSQSASASENFGVSQSHSQADSIAHGQGISETSGVTHAESVGQSLSHGQSLSETTGVSHTESVGQSVSHGQSISESATFGESLSRAAGFSQSFGESVGASVSQGRGVNFGESISLGETRGVTWGVGANHSLAAGLTDTSTIARSLSESLSQAFGITDTNSDSTGDAESTSRTTSGGGSLGGRLGGFNLGSSLTQGSSFNRGVGDSDSISSTLTTGGSFTSQMSEAISKAFTETKGISENVGGSTQHTTTAGQNVGQSEQVTAGQSITATQTTGASEAVTAGQTASRGFGLSETVTAGQSIAQSQGLSRSVGVGESITAGQSVGQSLGLSRSLGTTESLSAGRSVGVTDGVSAGTATSQTVGAGQSVGQSATQSQSVSQSMSQSQATSQSVSRASSLTESLSATAGRSAGVSASDTTGSSVSASQSRGLSDAYLVGMGRTAQATGSFGLVPTVGISISRQTRDEAKRIVGDILEAQMKRYLEGIESGAFFYQMFLQADNPETLARAAGLLKSAFWGPGDSARLPQPFHVISYNELDPEEVGRLLEHARALSSYRRREPDAEFIEPYVYSTYITPGEMAAFTHPPTAEGLGLLAVHDSMPVFAMPYDRANRDIHLGYIVNGERAQVTDTHYGIDLKEINHTLVAGITGSGKALPLDTPIPTPTGWTTMGELRVGDYVLTRKGTPTKVTFATGVMENHDCYRITFSDGFSMVADAEHLWQVADRPGRVRKSRRDRNGREPYTGKNAEDRKLIRRLEKALAAGDLGIDGLTDIISVIGHEGLVRAAVRSQGLKPVGTERRLMLQRYGDKEVKKHHHVKVYDVAEVYRAVVAALEERIEKRQGTPVERLVTTEEMARAVEREDGAKNWAIRVTDPLDLPAADLPVDPYVLGVWLGEGNADDACFTCSEPEIVEFVRARGYEVTQNAIHEGKAPLYQIHNLGGILRQEGLLGDKHIPMAYLRASREQRLDLLRGIVDTDGQVTKQGGVEVALTDEQLARDVWELALTLGYKATFRQKAIKANGEVADISYTVAFTTADRVAQLPSKLAGLPETVDERTRWRYVVAVEKVESVPVRCIAVEDEEHLFLAGEAMVPTHNTTTVLKLLTEAVQTTRTVLTRLNPGDPNSPHITKEVPAGALCLDWQRNMRSLANVVEPDRFKLFSMSKPSLGEFRWNLLAVPTSDMSPVEWANTIADQFMISYGLGEYARSIIWEHIDALYSANRLEPYELMPPQRDEAAGNVIRPGVILPPLDRSMLPPEAIQVGPDGEEFANVYTWPELSRLIGVGELALSISGRIEQLGTQEAGRMFGTEIRNRYQTIWRRLQYFAPGGPFSRMFTCDPSLEEKVCLTVEDLVDPEKGLVTVIEADGLDVANRRLVLGTILMSVWRYGQTKGEGCFNLGGEGPGTFVILEEAHELFGSQGDGEDHATAQTRTTIYESMFRRARALGLKLVAVCQNVGDIPAGIYSNTGTVILHRLYDRKDREVAASLMNWDPMMDQRREKRYLGEMPLGWTLVRLEPQSHYLEAAPVHIVVDPSDIAPVSDLELLELAQARKAAATS